MGNHDFKKFIGKDLKMLHARPAYNRIPDPENQIPDKEPVFLLRAQDIIAADVVRIWATLHKANGGQEGIARLAEEQADRMDKWAKKKLADL